MLYNFLGVAPCYHCEVQNRTSANVTEYQTAEFDRCILTIFFAHLEMGVTGY